MTEVVDQQLTEPMTDRAAWLHKKLTVLTLVGVIVEVVALYVILSPPVWVSVGLYDSMALFPDKSHCDISKITSQIEDYFHLKVVDVHFPAMNGARLHGYFLKLPGAKKVMLYSHGNGGNIEYRLPAVVSLLGSGASVFVYDYQGYGTSAGHPALTTICGDAACAYDYLIRQFGYRPEDIILYGESLGTGVTCELSQTRKCCGIILVSGFASLIGAGRDRLPWLYFYPDWIFPQPHFENIEIVAKPHPPLLIVHGKKDTLLDYSNSTRLMQAASPPKAILLLDEADHNNAAYDPLFVKTVRQFVASLK
jgi:uncharacterized protein